MNIVKSSLIGLLIFVVGFGVGGYLFSKTQKRQVVQVAECKTGCLSSKDIAGIVASIGIQQFPGFVPQVVMETDKSLVLNVQYPPSSTALHYVIVPKIDIQNISQINATNEAYLDDAFAVMNEIVQEKNLVKYRIVTNGPGYQKVTYLHFHLIAD